VPTENLYDDVGVRIQRHRRQKRKETIDNQIITADAHDPKVAFNSAKNLVAITRHAIVLHVRLTRRDCRKA